MRKGKPDFWSEMRRVGGGERGWMVTRGLLWSSACSGESTNNNLASSPQNRAEQI